MIQNDLQRINGLFKAVGIKASVAKIEPGLRTCKYYIQLELGEKVTKIRALEEEISLLINSITPPITAVDSKSGYVTIEATTTDQPIIIPFNEILNETNIYNYQLPLLLGRNMANENIAIDLVDCPHLLVGGSTGSGKSILLKSFLHALCARHPDALDLCLVDPKGTELKEFQYTPQCVQYCTNYDEVKDLLTNAIDLMEKRYAELSMHQLTNFQDLLTLSDDYRYTVIVIDELADILLQDRKQALKTDFIRLIQKSRAAGIHIIAATQRPSRDVVDGLIRANMPVQIALKTASSIDSRIIIEQDGAEKLVGRGDMLLNYNGSLTRIQGTLPDRVTFNRVRPIQEVTNF